MCDCYLILFCWMSSGLCKTLHSVLTFIFDFLCAEEEDGSSPMRRVCFVSFRKCTFFPFFLTNHTHIFTSKISPSQASLRSCCGSHACWLFSFSFLIRVQGVDKLEKSFAPKIVTHTTSTYVYNHVETQCGCTVLSLLSEQNWMLIIHLWLKCNENLK